MALTHVPPGYLCNGCGYELAGLPIDGVCPECARPVSASLHGGDLQYAAPEHLASLERGCLMVQTYLIASLIVGVALLVISIVAQVSQAPGAQQVVSFLGSLANVGLTAVYIAGWWLLSKPDPSRRYGDLGESPRRIARIAVVVLGSASLLQFAGTMLAGFSSTGGAAAGSIYAASGALLMIAGIASLIASCVNYFASMYYLRWLAPRIPNPKAEARAKQLLWLGPVLYIFGCGIGGLVALVLFYQLLSWIRADVRGFIADARDDAGFAPATPTSGPDSPGGQPV